MKNFFIKNRTNILIIIVFLILPWIFFKDSFHINTLVFSNGDPNFLALPMRQIVMDSIKNFDAPFWNRYIFSGFPLFANPQASIFYPIVFILDLIFPLSVSYNLSILLHYSLFGIFLFLFLDEYKLNKIASFTAGLIFMFSGFIVSHKGQPWMLYAMVWCPLILLFLEKFRKSRRFEFVLVASIFYSFSFFGGSMHLFLYSSIIILLFIIYYSLIYETKNFYFLLSTMIFVFGALLISVQLIPTYELMQNSVRSTMEYGYFTSFSYDIRLIPTLFFPFIFGYGPTGIPYFGPWTFGEVVAYFGIATMPFAIFGIFNKNKHKYFWIFILVFSFLLVLGGNTPFYKLMYHIPLYNKFRGPTKNWFEFGLAFSILSGFGLNYFIENTSKKIKKATITSIVFLFSVASVFLIFSYYILEKTNGGILYRFGLEEEQVKLFLQSIKITNQSIYIPLSIIAITIILLLISLFKKQKAIYFLFVFLIFFDLFTIRDYTESSVSKDYIYKDIENSSSLKFLKPEDDIFRIYPYVNFAPEGYWLYPNMTTHYDLEIISGNDPLALSNYNYVTGLGYFLQKDGVERLLKNNNILSILNNKYIFYFKPSDEQQFLKDIGIKANYKIAWEEGDVIAIENPNYIPRFSFMNSIIPVANLEEARKVLWEETDLKINESFNPSKTALVENPDFNKTTFNTQNSKIQILQYKNNKIVLKTESLDDSYLVFSDTYYPGWKAYIDKKETKIYKTDGVLKGIYIPAGSHEIIFNFLPSNFWLGVLLTIFSYIALITIASILFSKNKTNKKPIIKQNNK